MDKNLIEELYIKYSKNSQDSWVVASGIINELVSRDDYPDDSSYYYHIYQTWKLIQEYIDSTY